MTVSAELLQSVTETIADYREGEIPKPTPDHVGRWISQFPEDLQETLLRELDHILDTTYLQKTWVVDFLKRQIQLNNLAGDDPCNFWKNANFLNIQQNGHSQEEMIKIFGECLQEQCDLQIEDCGSKDGPFVYLDDGLFNGFRVGSDLCAWLEDDAPEKGDVYLLMIASHKYGEWKVQQTLEVKAKELNKSINFHYWRAISFENRKYNSKNSEVLWPTVLPDDELLKAYIAEDHKFPFEVRKPGGICEHKVFSCEESRQLIETQLLLAGLKIRSFCENPSSSLRPLGFSPFGLGFGATVITFRNCPNNCPLALWWGDPEADESHPFSKWYPLLPRKTYKDESNIGGFIFE